jgi:inorganic pyrophosphatase
MSKPIPGGLREFITLLFRAHPWHGVSVGDEASEKVAAFIGIVPTDTVLGQPRDLPAAALGA